MKKITAKFPGTCGICGGRFEAGIEIFWAPGKMKHADPAACAAEFKAAEAAEAAEKKAAWAAELAAMPAYERECHEREAWNVGHGLCPDGCCGVVKECGVAGCACKGA